MEALGRPEVENFISLAGLAVCLAAQVGGQPHPVAVHRRIGVEVGEMNQEPGKHVILRYRDSAFVCFQDLWPPLFPSQ
jgi:hypothetical protein